MLKGGIADKLGNEYEALWTLADALRVLRGEADEIRIEPLNEGAKGLEFRITASRRSWWHQCKRRLESGRWSIPTLESAGILSHFMRKEDPNPAQRHGLPLTREMIAYIGKAMGGGSK